MKLLRRLRSLFRKDKLDADMAEEMRLHIELQTERNLAAGMSADEARYAALRQFGNVAGVQERAREGRGWVWLEQLGQDFRYALRAWRKAPAFTAISAISLGLGIGAITAVFSLADAIFLRPLPVRAPDELVRFEWANGPSGGHPRLLDENLGGNLHFSRDVFAGLQAEPGLLSGVCATANLLASNVSIDHQAEVVFEGEFVSGNYHDFLGVRAFRGRTLRSEDDRPGAPPVGVISYRYWQSRFAGDDAALGKTISVNQVPVTIVGVTPPGFRGVMLVGNGADITLPLALAERVRRDGDAVKKREYWWLNLFGRRNPAHSVREVETGLQVVFQAAASADLKKRNDRDVPRLITTAGSHPRSHFADVRQKLLNPLIVTAVLALLAAGSNVVNLLLARGANRRRELAVRLALGAGRGRIVRQLLIESLLLGALGAGAGLIFAQGSLALLAAMFAEPYAGSGYISWFNPDTMRMGTRVYVFSVVIALVTSMAAGLVPALRATRVNLAAEFEGGTHSHGTRTLSRLSQLLVVVQVAVALSLLTGAALCARTLNNLHAIDLGFRREKLLLFATDAQGAGIGPDQYSSLPRRIAERIRAMPGVQAVSYSGWPVLTGEGGPWAAPIQVPGAPGDGGRVIWNQVGPDFFETYAMPLVAGRGFSARDDELGLKPVVVNESFAIKYFGKENPIGQRVLLEGDREIVGVVRDAKLVVDDLRAQTSPMAFIPFAQRSGPVARFVVRTDAEPEGLIVSVRKAVDGVATGLPIVGMSSQQQQVEWRFAKERLSGSVAGFIGLLAAILASGGLYGLISYSVSRRTPEIGIRMAVGAGPGQVVWMVFRESLTIVFVGIIAGSAGSAALMQLAISTFYGVSPTDPGTYTGVALGLAAVASIACWLPARRAAKVDPMVALRAE